MRRGIVAIYDTDAEYGRRLMEYLNRQEDFLLEASSFTTLEKLSEALEEQKIQILLAAGNLPTSIKNHKNAGRLLQLSETGIVREEEAAAVYKYQPAQAVMKKIMAACVEGELIPLASARDQPDGMKIYTFYSPCGGSGKTMLSRAFAAYLGQRGPVLYVDWELFSSRERPEQGFSTLMFQVRRRKTALSLALKAMTVREGHVDYLGAADSYQDLLELSGEDTLNLLEALSETGLYDTVVFDIGFPGDAVWEVFRRSEKIFFPIPEGCFAERKWESFQNALQEEELSKKGIRIPVSSGLLAEMGRSAAGNRITEKLAAFAEAMEKE